MTEPGRERIELRGERVVLRGFRSQEVELGLRRMQTVPAIKLDDAAARERRERLERSGARNDWELLFAIDIAGRLVGDIHGRCPRYAMPPGVWELGIELWDVEDRGRGFGRDAVALLTDHLFEAEEAIRVQATTDVENVSMRRVLEVLGFANEGTLRGFMPEASGPPRDYVMYGMTKGDWVRKPRPWMRTS